MKLWIRSQDKRHLIKADYVSIMENNIINVASSGWDYDVAKYETEERAIEVLDEIQKILKPQLIIKDSGKIIGSFEDTIIREGATYVYEMPED